MATITEHEGTIADVISAMEHNASVFDKSAAECADAAPGGTFVSQRGMEILDALLRTAASICRDYAAELSRMSAPFPPDAVAAPLPRETDRNE